jgi:hypothetical protein
MHPRDIPYTLRTYQTWLILISLAMFLPYLEYLLLYDYYVYYLRYLPTSILSPFPVLSFTVFRVPAFSLVLSRRMPRSTGSTASAQSSFDAQCNPDGVMSLERRLERHSTPAISLHALLDALHETPMLQYFELRQCFLLWNDKDASWAPPIQI